MFDAIVVGARCAGSPTAMLLARKGYRVLLLDKTSFPSDTLSTHFIHSPGVERMKRWGVLKALEATNCPPIRNLKLYMNGEPIVPPRSPEPPSDAPNTPAYCPRRTILDKILVDAAVEAGAELREHFSVNELLMDGENVTGTRGRSKGGSLVTEEARVVIGADGLHSTVARAVMAPEYNTRPVLAFAYYTYWSGDGVGGAELHIGNDHGILVFPTHNEQTCVAIGGPIEQFHEFREDIEGNYWSVIEKVPSLMERLRGAKREEPFLGTADQPNFFRRPYGPGWALVGDAGYHRDFTTGLGITDAFRDADLLAEAIDDGFAGRRPLDEALSGYEQQRNEIATPLYEFTCQLAAGELGGPEDFLKFGLALTRT